jgi:hypothetical protein
VDSEDGEEAAECCGSHFHYRESIPASPFHRQVPILAISVSAEKDFGQIFNLDF